MAKIYISAIAAMSENRVIGINNALPWHIPEDFKFFKQTTLGHPILMGRKSYESLGRPLPKRANIVVTRSGGMEKLNDQEGPFVFDSVKAAVEFAKAQATRDGKNEVFITGGGEIYKQMLPITDRIYLTIIHREYDGDTFFPEFDKADWHVTREERHEGDPAFTFFTFERKSG